MIPDACLEPEEPPLRWPWYWLVSVWYRLKYALDVREYSWNGPKKIRWSAMRYWCWWEDRFHNSLWVQEYFRRVKCRWQGHPKGIVFNNPGGLEPDTHCSNCGEDIG